MPYQPSVSSSITRNTTSVQGISLDFPIFCAAHTYFKERTRNYGSWDEFRDDGSVPVGSNTYNAVKLAFSQNPAPSRVYVGRRLADETIVTPDTVSIGKTYGFDITTYNNTTGAIASATVSFTAIAATKVSVVTAWKPLVDALTGATSAITGDTLSIEADVGYTVVVKGLIRSTTSFVTTELAGALLTAVQEEDNDWYCMTAEDHTEVFQLAMASAIEATGGGDFPKIYWTSTIDEDSIVPVVDPAIDVGGKLKELGYTRTFINWDHTADTTFSEIGWFSYNAVYQAGSTTYKFMQVAGVPAAADPVTGNRLTTAQQGYLRDRNMCWMGVERGINFSHGGTAVKGTSDWADIVIGSDWLNDQIEVAVLNLFLNQKGNKIAYAQPDKVKSVIDSVLLRAVNVGFLDGYVGAEIPDYITEIPFADKVARILKDVKWTGYLAGAVHFVVINGNLTYQSAELN